MKEQRQAVSKNIRCSICQSIVPVYKGPVSPAICELCRINRGEGKPAGEPMAHSSSGDDADAPISERPEMAQDKRVRRVDGKKAGIGEDDG